LVENHKLPRVSYQLYIDVPPHLEGEYAGTDGMMGQMLRRATSTKNKEEIDEAIDFIGANLSASGNGAFASTISKYQEQTMALMAEVVLDARFPEEEFAKVKDEAIAGLKSNLADPGTIAGRVRRAISYGTDHPFGELTTEETMQNVELAQVKEYYDTYFVPNRSYLVMVGDLTRAEAEKLAKMHFADWQQKDVPTPEYAMPSRPSGVTVNFVPKSGSVQSNIVISHPIKLEPGTKEAIRADIVNRILGSGFNGRLFQNLREDKAYTYGAYSSVTNSKVVGNFRATSEVRNEVTDSAMVEFMMELNKISTEPVTADELSRAKNQLAGEFGRALESPQRIASFALNTVRYGLDRNFYPDYLKKVEASSANDLLEVASDYMSPQNTNVIVVGDKAVAEKLARFATSGKVDYYDVNGMPVSMEDMAAPSDLTPKSVIEGYVKAIGGAAALEGINSLAMTLEASVQGQTVQQTLFKEGGNKFSSQTTAMGMVMMDQRYNDGKAKMTQQGQTMPENPATTATLAEQSSLFPVADLLGNLDKVTLEGVEDVDGRKAVVLAVEGPTGTARHFFDQETMLRVRQTQKQGPTDVTIDLGDYREVNGVMMPYAMTIKGVMPFPLEMKVVKAEANGTIDQELFKID
ncbi:MAG: pitrilysin family protein, partial [Bacteroidota bacterium]